MPRYMVPFTMTVSGSMIVDVPEEAEAKSVVENESSSKLLENADGVSVETDGIRTLTEEEETHWQKYQTPSDTDEPCEDCEGKRYLHMEDPFEIQACDTCSPDFSDDSAVELHAVDCECDWPPYDYQRALVRWLEGNKELLAPLDIAAEYRRVYDLAEQREKFLENLPQIHKRIKDLIPLVEGIEKKPLFPNYMQAKHLVGALALVEQAIEKFEKGKFNHKWLGDADSFMDAEEKAEESEKEESID